MNQVVLQFHLGGEFDLLIEDIICEPHPVKVVSAAMVKCCESASPVRCVVKDEIEVAGVVEPDRIACDIPDCVVVHDRVMTQVVEVNPHRQAGRSVVVDAVVADLRIMKIGVVPVHQAQVMGEPTGFGKIVVLEDAFHQAVNGDQVAAGMLKSVVADDVPAAGK